MTRIDENAKNIKLDVKDKKILELLEKDSRISFQQIAKRLQLSRDISAYRVKKLIEREVISRFTLKFDYSNFSYTKFIILLQLREMNAEKNEEFNKFISKHKEIVEVIKYFDKWDYQLIVQCKNIGVLDSIMNLFNKSFSNFLLDQEVLYLISDYLAPSTSEKYDVKDIELLNLLLRNSRMSAIELGTKTDLSSDAVLYRLKKYKKIKFTTIINNNSVDLHTYDVVFSMRYFDKMQEAKLRTVMSNNKEIQDSYRLMGNWNLFMRIAVKKPVELQSLIKKLRTSFSDNIKDFDIMHAYKEVKNSPFV